MKNQTAGYHMINAAMALAGPIQSLCADVATVYPTRPSEDGGEEAVTNDALTVALAIQVRSMSDRQTLSDELFAGAGEV